MKAHSAVGLAKPLYLPDDIVFEKKIIPSTHRNVRSNTKRSASAVTRVTRHETANFNEGADANMHYRYLMQNPSPAAGYNCVSDDRRIVHLTPYDEDTWAAGTWIGNHSSDHHELCVNKGINHSRARYIAACLDAAVLYARGLPLSALVQHNYWTGKNCPLLLRRDGLWPWYVNQVQAAYNRIVAHVGGAAAIATVKVGDTFMATDRLNVRVGYGTKYKVVTVLNPEDRVTIIKDDSGTYQKHADGYLWFNVKGSWGTGWAASDWLQKVEAPSGGWTYPKPVVPPFWSELMKDGTTYVNTDDFLWFRTDALYSVKAGGTRRQLSAHRTNEVVGPDLKAGEQFRLAAVGRSGIDGKGWGITPGLTRVALDDLEFITED